MPDEPDYRPEVGSQSQDDLLDLGRRRSLPRWAIGALWAAVAAVAVGVVVTGVGSLNGGTKPKLGPTSSGPPIASSLLTGSAGDLAIDGKILYEFSSGALYRIDITDPASPVSDGVTAVNGLDGASGDATFHLVLDPAAHHVWVVTYGVAPANFVEFDSRTLAELGRLQVPSEVRSAAAYAGHLYLATTTAVLDITSPNRAPATITSLSGQYTSIVADPARSRLLLLGFDNGARVSSYLPATARSVLGPSAPFGKGDLLVVGGSIWAAGFGGANAVLARLDPTTLRPIVFSELSPQLGPGAIGAAAGTNVLWVRSGAGGDGLWCVDAGTGDQLQYWQYDGAVASAHGAAFVAQREGPLSLHLAACTG
ncbi:MAG: hypothetical protein ABI301_03255 [Jatrophihabitantaceae bacterium]